MWAEHRARQKQHGQGMTSQVQGANRLSVRPSLGQGKRTRWWSFPTISEAFSEKETLFHVLCIQVRKRGGEDSWARTGTPTENT